MDQLLLLVAILLHLQRQGLLPLLTMVHTFVHGREVLVNLTEDVGCLFLGIMEGSLQSVTLLELVKGTLY